MAVAPLDDAHRRIASAAGESDLVAAAAAAHDAVQTLIDTRVGAASVAEAWSAVARAALSTAARLVGPGMDWFASGSVGRGDALPGSDLETLAVRSADVTAESALAQAVHVHDLLACCGLRGDDNGAIASRARFNRTAQDWAIGIGRWATDPAADRGVVMIGLLADAVPVDALVGGPDLRDQAGIAARAQPAALAAMLQDSTFARGYIPSRLRVLTSGDSRIDIKLAAVDPVVRIARWAALSCGCDALPTAERIAAAAGTRYLDPDDARVLAKCHAIGSSIRWRVRAARWDSDSDVDERVELSELSPQDRTALRSIGRELTGVRRKLDYLASTSTFSSW
ncbi:putative nucleotidyltransferase substrate binding domain-containing protein [Mycolicibacterium sp. 050232]|uniref:putative nucleotidyltransferase substrate binding domain-containing protein n=1 Tax=Mycolicibacterium sp. 050232 TaxID=3113982 RepID=UPI002E297E5B|nr:putative nucleotidyltransferase substrate binding domain-containing protein [Mycolicibacterium sp. 050232]MED5812139.1 putative nucleotidyltransferase substrate binding domain-containing protein [Mycolicibacterium sp. 050232]